jgi:hypothetical protein
MKKEIKLNDIPKRNVHQVPDGYFDRLPMRVMERTAAREQVTAASWLTTLWRHARYTVAPLILLFLFAGIYFFNLQQEPIYTRVPVATLNEEEIIDYLSTYAQVEAADLEEYSIAEQEFTADFLNINARTAEAELEYYHLNDIDY